MNAAVEKVGKDGGIIREPKLLAGVPIVAEASVGKNWGEMRKLGALHGR